MYIILMMSAKMARSGFLKITVFWNNAYDVIISVKASSTKFYHVIQILLYMCSCDQSLAILAFLWKKLSQPQFYKELNRKIAFFEGWSCFKFNNLRLPLGTNLKFYISVAKGLKLKVRKFWGLIPTFVEVTYVMEECIIKLNWLYKHMKKVRSSQPPILVLNWIKHGFSLWVSLCWNLHLNYIAKFIFESDCKTSFYNICWENRAVDQLWEIKS